MSVIQDAEAAEVLLDDSASPRFARAAELLEKAISAGCREMPVLYMLGIAYKRQGKTAEAHASFRKIGHPDADVFLQMALISLQDKEFARAEEELSRARELDPSSYEVCHNLLMTRLTLGKIGSANELVVPAIDLAGQRGLASERRFLIVLHGLSRNAEVDGDPRFDAILADLTSED